MSTPVNETPYTHARQRAAQRYGLTLTDSNLRTLIKRIEAGAPYAVSVRRDAQPSRVHVAVRWRDTWILAVYDERRRHLVTFLPPHEIRPFRERLEREAGVRACPSGT